MATLPAPPLPDISAYIAATDNSGQTIHLLEDPADVDERRYRQLHLLWTHSAIDAPVSRPQP